MVTITEKAQKKIKEFAEEQDCSLSIRLKIIGGGCAGYQHDMMFDDITSALDEVFEVNGIKVIMDQLTLQYLEDCEVDYVEHLYGNGFKINSPNQKGSCGCGSSVAY